MPSKSTALGVAGLLALAPIALAQQPVYAQCGGMNWTGGTTCVSGSTCVKSNDYYSQCLPGSGGVTTTSAKPTTTVKPTTTTGPTTGKPTGTTTSSAPASTSTDNPYVGYGVYLSPYYAAEIKAAVATIKDSTLAAKAAKVANIPTFTWLDTISKVPTLDTYLADAQAQQTSTGKKLIVQIVVYDLPDRDCHAKASNGELSIANNGVSIYKSQYIDAIAAIIKKYPDVRVVAVVEPDSLANIVTNLSDPKCSNAQTAYKDCVSYAVKTLSQPNVYLYLDAGHAGWLGWSANIQPAAQMFGSILTQAGGQYRVRGLATNVANYNALNAASPDPITQGNSNYDESHYINALAPLLTQYNYPAHFIVDQGRSGVQNIRSQWGDWCNIKGAGFGTQPTTSTGNSYIDSIVWVKPGGESDGTSNTTSTRYDSTCGLSDATQPAPEAGTWFEAYFETLVSKANPAI